MKIALVLGSFSIGTRPLDFEHLYDSPRGLTGTDLCFIRLGEELRKLGNEVEMIHNVNRLNIDESFDAVISINEPNLLIGISPKIKRILYMMLNDFSFVQPGFNEWTDLYIGVCQQHSDYVEKQYPETKGKWATVPLGCDPELYKDERVSGRVVWCSSADRGLHWLLQQWPEIKAAVPEASLRIMYHFNYGAMDQIEAGSISPQGGPYHHHIQEMAQRIRYMKDAIKKLKDLGVEHVGSVSREQMVKEWNEASVFAFSTDTVAFSEGFSVSTLEGHASFTVPVLTSCDCLGGIYKDSGCSMIEAPVQDHLKEFTDAVIRGLKDKEHADAVIAKCRDFAANHTWKQCAYKINKLVDISTNIKE